MINTVFETCCCHASLIIFLQTQEGKQWRHSHHMFDEISKRATNKLHSLSPPQVTPLPPLSLTLSLHLFVLTRTENTHNSRPANEHTTHTSSTQTPLNKHTAHTLNKHTLPTMCLTKHTPKHTQHNTQQAHRPTQHMHNRSSCTRFVPKFLQIVPKFLYFANMILSSYIGAVTLIEFKNYVLGMPISSN